MHYSERDFPKKFIKKNPSKPDEQYIMYTHLYGNTLFDLFDSLFFCDFKYKKKVLTL